MSTITRPRPEVKPARKPRTVKPAHGTARLELVINGHGYVVRLMPTDPAAGVSKLIFLRKIDGDGYHVSRHPHGNECTCPDFTFSRDGIDARGCKHILACQAVGLL